MHPSILKEVRRIHVSCGATRRTRAFFPGPRGIFVARANFRDGINVSGALDDLHVRKSSEIAVHRTTWLYRPPLCSGGTQVRHGAKMASKTDAVLRFFCLGTKRSAEGEVCTHGLTKPPRARRMATNIPRGAGRWGRDSPFAVQQENRISGVEDHV